jgi:hypothetical protein
MCEARVLLAAAAVLIERLLRPRESQVESTTNKLKLTVEKSESQT